MESGGYEQESNNFFSASMDSLDDLLASKIPVGFKESCA